MCVHELSESECSVTEPTDSKQTLQAKSRAVAKGKKQCKKVRQARGKASGPTLGALQFCGFKRKYKSRQEQWPPVAVATRAKGGLQVGPFKVGLATAPPLDLETNP